MPSHAWAYLAIFVAAAVEGEVVFVAAILVGMVDTVGRAFLPSLLRALLPPSAASQAGPALASMMIYVLMAAVLAFRPQGLFPARTG